MLRVVSVKWDYDRFAESEKKRVSNQFFVKSHLGSFSNPATIVDMHGKILVWYLPGLLLPHQVVSIFIQCQPFLYWYLPQEQFNKIIKTLKQALNESQLRPDSWCVKGFISDSSESIFGAGRLGISVGRLIPGHKVSGWLFTSVITTEIKSEADWHNLSHPQSKI